MKNQYYDPLPNSDSREYRLPRCAPLPDISPRRVPRSPPKKETRNMFDAGIKKDRHNRTERNRVDRMNKVFEKLREMAGLDAKATKYKVLVKVEGMLANKNPIEIAHPSPPPLCFDHMPMEAKSIDPTKAAMGGPLLSDEFGDTFDDL